MVWLAVAGRCRAAAATAALRLDLPAAAAAVAAVQLAALASAAVPGRRRAAGGPVAAARRRSFGRWLMTAGSGSLRLTGAAPAAGGEKVIRWQLPSTAT